MYLKYFLKFCSVIYNYSILATKVAELNIEHCFGVGHLSVRIQTGRMFSPPGERVRNGEVGICVVSRNKHLLAVRRSVEFQLGPHDHAESGLDVVL